MAGFSGSYLPPTQDGADQAGSPALHSGPAMRPLSMGEALDRIFFLYRSNFRLFLLLGSLPAAVGLINSAVQLPFAFGALRGVVHGHVVRQNPLQSVSSIVGALIVLTAMVFVEASCADVVSHLYQRQPVSAGQSLRASFRHWPRYLLVYLWRLGSAIWLPALLIGPAVGAIALRHAVAGGLLGLLGLAGLVYGVIAYIRNSLALPAAMVEQLPVAAAMRRSKALVAGRKGRIFLLLLLAGVVYGMAGALESPFTLFALRAGGVGRVVGISATLLIQVVISAVSSALLGIAFAVFYFDERVRREGFDVELLLQQAATDIPRPFAG
jgi:hypothetical protein